MTVADEDELGQKFNKKNSSPILNKEQENLNSWSVYQNDLGMKKHAEEGRCLDLEDRLKQVNS